MDVEEYKNICNKPNVFQRGLLEASERELVLRHLPSAYHLQEILIDSPISKPRLHNDRKDADYFLVKLDVAKAEEIVEYLVDAEADAVGREGETTPQASHYASLVDVWMRYIDFCDGKAD